MLRVTELTQCVADMEQGSWPATIPHQAGVPGERACLYCRHCSERSTHILGGPASSPGRQGPCIAPLVNEGTGGHLKESVEEPAVRNWGPWEPRPLELQSPCSELSFCTTSDPTGPTCHSSLLFYTETTSSILHPILGPKKTVLRRQH